MVVSLVKGVLNGLAAIISRLPLKGALALGRFAGWVFGYVIRHHRKDAVDALTRSFPEKSPGEIRGIVHRMYLNFGMNLAELARLPRMSKEDLLQLAMLENVEYVRDALKGGKGAIALAAHMGNWDLVVTMWPVLGFPITIITKDIKNKGLNEFWMDLRSRFGLKFVPAHNSYRHCIRALRGNEMVGFILDQNMIREEGIFVDFFGRPACTSPGLAYMSAQSGAPVVPVMMIRHEEGRHTIRFLPAVEPPPDREPETIRAYTQRYTGILEDMIRQYPDQWIWLHRRWRTRPPAEAEVKAAEQAKA